MLNLLRNQDGSPTFRDKGAQEKMVKQNRFAEKCPANRISSKKPLFPMAILPLRFQNQGILVAIAYLP